jgi:hypothetical protein
MYSLAIFFSFNLLVFIANQQLSHNCCISASFMQPLSADNTFPEASYEVAY